VETVTGGAVACIEDPKGPIGAVAWSADGRIVAGRVGGRTLRLWDRESGRPVMELNTDGGSWGDLAFSHDNRILAAACTDTTILLWDVTPAWRKLAETEAEPKQLDLEDAWRVLSGGDARKAYRAVYALGRAGDRAVAFMAERLKPPPLAEDLVERVRRAVVDLDHDDIEVRDRASRALGELGAAAEPLMRKALAATASAEVRMRLERILAEAGSEAPGPLAPGEALGRHRAIWALERIGTPAARAALDRFAREAHHLRERREAELAAWRLAGRARAREAGPR
jgi:hypothetical protein